MTRVGLFTPRMLAAWIAAAVLTCVASLALMLHGEEGTTVGPSSFSRSALGYAGIADVLQRSGLTVIKSRGGSLHWVEHGGLLVLAEPQFHPPLSPADRALLQAPDVLLVLPKWVGGPDRHNPAWIAEAQPLPDFVPQAVLTATLGKSTTLRPDGPVSWSHNEIGPDPVLSAPVQLMTAPRLRPVVASAAGMLVGERTWGRAHHRLWVLSDPDVLNNHGLGDGNAAFAVALVNAVRNGPTVVFDETIHGFAATTNPAALLLHPPFTQVGIQALLAVLLLLWGSTGRFGAPEIAPPPLKSGKRDLVRNVATLFRYAGYQPVLARRYVEETIRDTARMLHAPRGLEGAALLGWLQRIGAARGASLDCADLAARANALPATGRARAADQAHLPADAWRWKQEMMHGTADAAGGRRLDPHPDPQGRGRPG